MVLKITSTIKHKDHNVVILIAKTPFSKNNNNNNNKNMNPLYRAFFI